MKKKLSAQENQSLKYIKNKITRNKFLNKQDFTPGKMLFYSYNPKDQANPYDKTPLILVIKANSKHILGLNLHWAPVEYRKKIIKILIKYNKENLKHKRDLEIPQSGAKELWRLARPIWRKYIKKRISRRGAVIEPEEMGNIIYLRSEHFIGISADDAFKLAIRKMRKN